MLDIDIPTSDTLQLEFAPEFHRKKFGNIFRHDFTSLYQF